MSEDDVRSYVASVAQDEFTGQLPAHWPTCLGCGPDNAAGYHLQVRREGDEVVTEHTFAEQHSGAPGIAHGGAPHVVRAKVDSRDGRKLWVSCACTAPDGTVTFTAKALFLEVKLEHFASAHGAGGSTEPVAP